ncbi:MAG TPA: RimK family alpha-L-glutamate ligase [Oligoflexia bacterium]|nr:RimK family alpha-L-glutamate ligase [Oligoflexia bacterium]
MKVTVLTRNRNLHSIRRLLKEGRALRAEVSIVDPLDCQLVVGSRVNGLYVHDRPASRPDVVIPRIGTSITDYGLAVVTQFEILNVPVINSARAIAESRDKLRCLQLLSAKNFGVPTTILSRSKRGTRLAFRQIGGVPAVLKLLQGTQGVGVMLAESMTSAESILDTMRGMEKDILLQQYIAESGGRDIRALVIGDKVVAAMRRQAKAGEFRSNIHRGGEGSPIELSDSYKKLAVNSAKAVGLGIAGVDILESLTGPKVIELNSSPGFEGIEKTTGLNIAKMILNYALQIARQKRRPARRR